VCCPREVVGDAAQMASGVTASVEDGSKWDGIDTRLERHGPKIRDGGGQKSGDLRWMSKRALEGQLLAFKRGAVVAGQAPGSMTPQNETR
jgi:hypothetical protein